MYKKNLLFTYNIFSVVNCMVYLQIFLKGTITNNNVCDFVNR